MTFEAAMASATSIIGQVKHAHRPVDVIFMCAGRGEVEHLALDIVADAGYDIGSVYLIDTYTPIQKLDMQEMFSTVARSVWCGSMEEMTDMFNVSTIEAWCDTVCVGIHVQIRSNACEFLSGRGDEDVWQVMSAIKEMNPEGFYDATKSTPGYVGTALGAASVVNAMCMDYCYKTFADFYRVWMCITGKPITFVWRDGSAYPVSFGMLGVDRFKFMMMPDRLVHQLVFKTAHPQVDALF